MTRSGTGYASPAMRSAGGPDASSPSRHWSITCWMRGRSWFIRRALNSRSSSFR